MSELLPYLHRELRDMHRLYTHVTSDLTNEQANHVPDGGHQNLAFCLWHFVRTEDNCIQFVIQRKPTVWMEGDWPEKFGLDSKSQGTGFTDDEARNFRISDIGDVSRLHGRRVQAHRGLRRRHQARRDGAARHREAARRDADPDGHLRPVHDARLPPPW